MSNFEVKILDLLKIFNKLKNEYYCIIKLPESFPSYKIGSDLDIFCFDVENYSRLILEEIQKYIKKDLEIRVKKNSKLHIYIDIIEGNKIHFRFDLYGTLPRYCNINIKKAFFSTIIENHQIKKINNIDIKIPSDIDEAILRYIEYQEWYAQRPDKIKHIEYLEKKIKENHIDSDIFFDKLHYYTELPDIKIDTILMKKDKENIMIRLIRYTRQNGILQTVKTIIRKLIK